MIRVLLVLGLLLCSPTFVMGQPVPTDKIRMTMKFFTSNGLSKSQAAGVVGNLIQESKLNPSARSPGKCYGIAQWLGRRFRQLKQFTHIRNRPWDCFDSQLLFIMFEFTNEEHRAFQSLQQTKTVDQATQVVGRLYLRPKRVESTRYKYAQQAYLIGDGSE